MDNKLIIVFLPIKLLSIDAICHADRLTMSYADDDGYDDGAGDPDYEETMVKFIGTLGFDEIKKLGEGGMGMAYRGRFRKDGTVRVLKVNRTKSESTDDELLEEGSRLQSLSHPHVAVLYELQSSTDTGGFSYLNMEYCKGGDLHHRCFVVEFSCFNVWSLGFKVWVYVWASP